MLLTSKQAPLMIRSNTEMKLFTWVVYILVVVSHWKDKHVQLPVLQLIFV